MTHPIHKIKDFCQVGDGAHASIKRGNTGIMYLSSKNFKPHGLDLTNLDYISQSDYEKHFKVSKSAITTPSANDVLLGIIGSIGVPYIVKAGDLFGISSSVAILRTQQGLDANYLFHYMRSSFFQQSVEAIKSGAAQGFLSLEMIRNLPLIAPEEGLQQQIADILTAYDDLIETNNQRIATLEAIAQQIYKEWFVRLRFPNWEHTPFHHGIPDGWEVKKVKDAFNVFGGGTPSKDTGAYWIEGNVNWFTPTDLTNSKRILIKESSLKCNETGYKESSARMFPAYSVMMTSRATIGTVAINTTEACTNQGFITCIPNEKVTYPYIFYWIKQNKEHFISFATGATFLEISKSTFNKIDILIPPESMMNKFSDFAYPLFNQIEMLQEQIDILTKTRNLLLPRLISGKLTLKQTTQQITSL